MNLRRRILVVDPDERLLIELEKTLEDAGFDTTTAWDLQEARAQLEKHTFHLVLVSNHPPEVNPSDLLATMAGIPHRPACVVLESSSAMHQSPFAASAFVCRRSSADVLRTVGRVQAGVRERLA